MHWAIADHSAIHDAYKKDQFCWSSSHFTMAQSMDDEWAPLLKAKYPSYTVEVQAFLDSLDIVTSSEISMEKIYEAIREDPKVNENLKYLYVEAIFGSNKDVRARIKNRVAKWQTSTEGWGTIIFYT